MIISRRKYERELQEAAEKARFELEKEIWQRDRLAGLQEQINELKRELSLLKGPNEGSTCNEAVAGLPF